MFASPLSCFFHFENSEVCSVTLVQQALLATKAVNEKARSAAYGLLVEIGRSFIRWHPELTQQGYLHILLLLTVNCKVPMKVCFLALHRYKQRQYCRTQCSKLTTMLKCNIYAVVFS